MSPILSKPESLYTAGIKKKNLIITCLFILLFLTTIYALNSGSYHLPFDRILTILIQSITNPGLLENTPSEKIVVIDFRLPRVLLAILTGISLAIAGCVMQEIGRASCRERV